MMPYRKIAAWTIGLMILGTGFWCLSITAKSALFAISDIRAGMPIDMRIMAFLSFSMALIFSGLFLFSGALSILQRNEAQISYTPTLPKLAMVVILIMLSVLAWSEYSATSKISWKESRGLPFAFLTLTEFRGLCYGGIAIWKCRFFEALNPLALIVDVLLVYSAICLSGQRLFESRISSLKPWLLRKNQIKESSG